MDKKKLIADFRNALKTQTLDADTFDQFCVGLNSLATTQDELMKIFNKTTISGILCLQKADVFCLMSSFFWDISTNLWEDFSVICKETKRIRNDEFFNEVIKHGDARAMMIVETLCPNYLDISDEFSCGSAQIGEEGITPEFAKKVANYRGKIRLCGLTISVESARILSHKKGAICITHLFNPYLYEGETPNWRDYHHFFNNVVHQSSLEESSIQFYAKGIDHFLAAILGNASTSLRLDGIEHLTVGIAKGLARQSRYGHNEGMDIGGDDLVCDPGALQEFRVHKGNLSLNGLISGITFDDAEALACHEGKLVIYLKEFPDVKTLEELMKIKHHLTLYIQKTKYKGENPWILQSPLSLESAEIISRFNGDYLNFGYIGEVPFESAEKLAKLSNRLCIDAKLSAEGIEMLREAGVNIRHLY